MTLFDRIDLAIIVSLFAASFWFGGSKWRWHVTVFILALHLLTARVLLEFLDAPIMGLALVHAGLAMVLLAYSASNYGRAIGLCFLLMLALDGLAISGSISSATTPGLSFNYWNCISTLQHIQALTLLACFWRYRRTAWAMV
jgi:hypothetical protein